MLLWHQGMPSGVDMPGCAGAALHHLQLAVQKDCHHLQRSLPLLLLLLLLQAPWCLRVCA
jgi:hypothetical protein